MEKYRGNPPAGGTWRKLGPVASGWEVYIRPGEGGWVNLKLVAIEPQPIKANYWLAWNGVRLSNSRDAATLEKRPELRDALMRLLQASVTSL